MKSPVSGSNANAEAETLALPPTNRATDLPLNNAGCVCTVTLQGVAPLHATKVKKKPLIGVPACICFNCPEMFTNAGCEHVTVPLIVAVPVVGSTDPNCETDGTRVNGGGP